MAMAMNDIKIEMFPCNQTFMPRIDYFRQIAEDQQEESEYTAADKIQKRNLRRKTRSMKPITADFVVLHPWRNECSENGYVFIAYKPGKPRPLIVGWMMVHIRFFEPRTRHASLRIAHVDYISTNRNTRKGIGREMMNFLEPKMIELRCDFIELMPLSDVVGFYTGLGYALQFREVNYYTKWLNDTPEKRGTLDVYNIELIKEMREISEQIEREEIKAFEEIFIQFDSVEKAKYHAMQDDDDSTRIGMILTFEDGGMDEVRKMLV